MSKLKNAQTRLVPSSKDPHQRIGERQICTPSKPALSSVPLKQSKLFLEDEKGKLKIDPRLPSQRLFRDNMLSVLRLVNHHPFAGILKVQEVTKNDVSISDLPDAIKSGTIQRTSQFDYLVNQIFLKCKDRLSHLHAHLN